MLAVTSTPHREHSPSPASSSGDELPMRRRKRKRLYDDEDSSLIQNMQDIKKVLQVLCQKVEKNERALKEIQEARFAVSLSSI